MKAKMELECTPEEARAFLGLPDLTPLNEHIVAEMRKRIDTNAALLQPDELVRAWTVMGGQAQEQFRKLMTTAAGLGSVKPKG